MMLTGFADSDRPDLQPHDKDRREPEHVAWSVPPQAAAALADRETAAWTDAAETPSRSC